MGLLSLRAWILAASLLSVSAVAHAAGLGQLNVMSALGEPLKAEIDLVAEKNDVGSLSARMGALTTFERAGIAYSPALSDVKLVIEKRASGEPYVRLTSTQPLNEPFLDLIVELSWASGRVTRQFTLLLDPPALIAERERQQAAEAQVRAAPAAPVAEPEVVPESIPAPTTTAEVPAPTSTPAATAEAPAVPPEATPAKPSAPDAPVETIGGSAPTLLDGAGAAPTSTGNSYGPVKSGDTLAKIARANKVAAVSLEQMLVLLFRSNPEAFSGRNMNRLKTGRILRMPSADQLGSVSETEARSEVRIQARDWNAYREQLATATGQSAPEQEPAQQAAAGKVGAKVEEKVGQAKDVPKEVVKLSKGEPVAGAVAGADSKAADRVRALEEELVARDKAVKDATERVARLEKTIKDLHALLEIKNKGLADLQKPATPPAAVATPPAASKPTATPAPVTEAKPAPAQVPAVPSEPKSEPAPPQAQPAPTKPKPASRPVAPPLPEPSLLDKVLDQPAYLGAGIGALLLIGALAVRAVKRRRESKSDSEDSGPARTGASAAAAYSGTDTDLRTTGARAASEVAEEVDPLAEAEIFLAYGRDAQAEELLKEALAATPQRHEVHLKLLQIYAKRKDVKAFEQIARELQQATGGTGELWGQAVMLGYQVDPGNPRYAAGRAAGAETAAVATAVASTAEKVDFNIGFEDAPSVTATDIDLGDSDLERTRIFNPAEVSAPQDAPAASTVMDLDLDLPTSAEPQSEKAAESGGGAIDFDFDLNALSPSTPAPESAVESSVTASGGIDFDMGSLSLESAGEPQLGSSPTAPEIDLSGISLDLGTETAPITSPTGKDDRWYDVQTKFDLAKAYQEMGDKDGARDILKEVLQEGDAEQRAAAQAVLSSLDA